MVDSSTSSGHLRPGLPCNSVGCARASRLCVGSAYVARDSSRGALVDTALVFRTAGISEPLSVSMSSSAESLKS
jgi:hypothetical protein